MKPPAILYVSIGSQVLPVLAGAYARGRLDSARVWIMLWSSISFMTNIAAGYLAMHRINNHFLSYAEICVQGPVILWALSLWQTKPVARLTFRLIIPPFLIAWVLLTLLVEDTTNFSSIAEPVYSMLALGAALYTVLSRGTQESEPLLQQDWFWICTGLAVHFVGWIVITPLGAAYVRTDPAMFIRASMVQFGINAGSFIVIAIGMLCPRQVQSGPSFSPRSSA